MPLPWSKFKRIEKRGAVRHGKNTFHHEEMATSYWRNDVGSLHYKTSRCKVSHHGRGGEWQAGSYGSSPDARRMETMQNPSVSGTLVETLGQAAMGETASKPQEWQDAREVKSESEETWVRGKFKMASAAPARLWTSWWVAAAAGHRSVGLASPDKLSFQLPTRLQRYSHWPRAVIVINHSSKPRKVIRTRHCFSSMRMQYHPYFPCCVHGPIGYEW